MKKFLKSIFITLCFSLVMISASVFLQINNVNSVYAVDNDNTHTVNIYSSDKKTILATYQVEDGKSLNDLDNNILYNGDFILNDNGLNSYKQNNSGWLDIVNNWRISGINSEYIVSSNYAYLVLNGALDQLLTSFDSSILGNEVTFSVKLNNFIGSGDIRIFDGFSTYVSLINGDGVISCSGVINSNSTLLRCLIFSQSCSFNIEYAKLELGSFATPYFSQSYITKLFRNANNLSNSDVVFWSTSQSTGLYNFNTPITSDIDLYGYEELEFNNNAEQLEAEMTYQPSYYLLEKAINNIEYIHYKGQFKFNVSIDTSKLSDSVQFLSLRSSKAIGNLTPSITSTTTQSQYFKSMALSNIGFDDFEYMNFALLSDNNSIYVELKSVNLIPTYTFYLVKNTGTINFVFSPSIIYLDVLDVSTSTIKPISFSGEVENFVFYNGTEINDMNSNTNYFLNFDYLTLSSNYYLDFSKLIEKQLTTVSMTYNYNDYNNSDKYLEMSLKDTTNFYYKFYQQNLYTFTGSDQFSLIFNGYNSDSITFLTNAIPDNAYIPLTAESGFYFSQFDIIVRKPVARVDNSLVIFNFGYNNFLNAVTQVKYELRRGINYYDVVYNGQLENSKMIVIDNEFVRNSLFDEYIFVSFIIGGDNTTIYDVKDGKIGTYLGFDFNFVYYTQPLVAGNASYDLMQYRPEYMDGTPSLVPLNIPFTAWIYNAFLWLIFDCPLISDILGFLHLQSFLGALLNIIELYVNSGIGQFVLACLSFILFWVILKSLMPSIVGGLSSSVSAAYKDYSDNKNIAMQQMRQKGRYKAFKFNKGRLNYHKKNGLSTVHHRNLVKKYFTGSFKSSRPKFK